MSEGWAAFWGPSSQTRSWYTTWQQHKHSPKGVVNAPCCSKWRQVPFPCQHIRQVPYRPSLCQSPVWTPKQVGEKVKGIFILFTCQTRAAASQQHPKPAGQGEDPTGLTGTSCHLERPAKVSTGGDSCLPTDSENWCSDETLLYATLSIHLLWAGFSTTMTLRTYEQALPPGPAPVSTLSSKREKEDAC